MMLCCEKADFIEVLDFDEGILLKQDQAEASKNSKTSEDRILQQRQRRRKIHYRLNLLKYPFLKQVIFFSMSEQEQHRLISLAMEVLLNELSSLILKRESTTAKIKDINRIINMIDCPLEREKFRWKTMKTLALLGVLK